VARGVYRRSGGGAFSGGGALRSRRRLALYLLLFRTEADPGAMLLSDQNQTHDIDPRAQEALRGAAEARNAAYAPYSGFKMGAAVVTDGGAVTKGALVENVSLGLAMCAERVALFTAVTNAAGKPEILALVSRRTDGELTWPCGACLQVAMEFAGPELLVIVSDGSEARSARLGDLGPHLPVKR
jgi:cytidine deaminase